MDDEISYSQTLTIWWSMVWRGFLLGVLAGAIAGFIGGVLAAFLGMGEKAAIFGAVAGYLVGIPVSIWALRKALIVNNVRFSRQNELV